jgi:hypothetical protein
VRGRPAASGSTLRFSFTRRGRRGAVLVGVLLSVGLGAGTGTAVAAPPPICDKADAPPPLWEYSAPRLVFGTVIATGVVASERGWVNGPADEPDKIQAALNTLQGPSKPFLVKALYFYNDPGDPGAIATDPPHPTQYAINGRRLDAVLWFNSKSRNVNGWVRYVRRQVRKLSPYAGTILIGEEANHDTLPPPWGTMPVEAIVEGVLAAKEELRKLGNRYTKIGFNASWNAGLRAAHGDTQFFEEIAQLGGDRFRRAVDFFGVDMYPGGLGGSLPSYRQPAASMLRHVRLCWMRTAGLPDSVPLYVTENGWATSNSMGRTYEAQAAAVEELVRAVHDYRAMYNVRAYEFWGLRDDDTSLDQTPTSLGLLESDYTPKPAFDVYRRLIASLGARYKHPKAKITAAPSRKTADLDATFRFRSVPGDAEFECKLDDRPWRFCSAPQRYEDLKPGRHKFQVRATGEGLRVPTPPATYGWRVVRDDPGGS